MNRLDRLEISLEACCWERNYLRNLETQSRHGYTTMTPRNVNSEYNMVRASKFPF